MHKIISKINEALKEQGLSETKLAEKAGLGQKTVNRMLKGETKRLNMATVSQLCKVLGLDFKSISEEEPTGDSRRDGHHPPPEHPTYPASIINVDELTPLQLTWIETGLKMGDLEMLEWLVKIKKGHQ